GAVLLPLGLLVIGLGWYGAAHTPYSYEQTPYLISGGLLGVGIVLTGGFIYFGTWLARLLVENRAAADRLAALLEKLDERESVGLGALVPTQTAHSRVAANLVATPTGTMVHRPDCSVV